MNEVIFEHGGTIDKFIGDAIMVLFGAPQDMSPQEQVKRAADCAKAMQRAMLGLTNVWKKRALATFGCGLEFIMAKPSLEISALRNAQITRPSVRP